jgi:hypothetical protein
MHEHCLHFCHRVCLFTPRSQALASLYLLLHNVFLLFMYGAISIHSPRLDRPPPIVILFTTSFHQGTSLLKPSWHIWPDRSILLRRIWYSPVMFWIASCQGCFSYHSQATTAKMCGRIRVIREYEEYTGRLMQALNWLAPRIVQPSCSWSRHLCPSSAPCTIFVILCSLMTRTKGIPFMQKISLLSLSSCIASIVVFSWTVWVCCFKLRLC